jgi:hypothetical protein
MTNGFAISRVSSRGGIDAFEYTATGTLEEAHEDASGNRVDSLLETSATYVTVCGVGRSRVPSCTEPIYVAGRSMGDPYAARSWDLDEGGVVRLGAFPDGTAPYLDDDDGSAAAFAVALH